MSVAQTTFDNRGPSGLESVVSTEEFARRASRPPDYAAENKAMISLAQVMATSPAGILQKLSDTALALCNAGSAGVSLLEPDGAHFYWPVITGAWAAQVGGGTPREFGPCGTVLDRNAPQLMSRPERHFTYLAGVTPEIEEVLLIPFYVEKKAVGTMWVVAHDPARRFDPEDLRIMSNLCTFAAAAYQMLMDSARIEATQHELRNSLAEQQKQQEQMEETIKRRTKQLSGSNDLLLRQIEERLQTETTLAELSGRLMRVQDDEQRRIARELHDATGQVLAALSMNLSRMQKVSSPENLDKFQECMRLVNTAGSEIRNLSYRLHPPLMDEMGLATAVAHYASGYESRSKLRIAVHVASDVGRIEDDYEITLFRIVQEALGNIHRHSGSPTAHIRITREQKAVTLEITDQGRGIEPGKDGKIRYGVGLTGMKERLRLCGGTLSIESGSAGTKVTAILPDAAEVKMD